MTRPLRPLATNALPSPCHVVGVMSGTSFDGIDAVLVRLSGTQKDLDLVPLASHEHPYPDVLHDILHTVSIDESISLDMLARLPTRLAHLYADAVRALVEQASIPFEDVHLVGVHGQTVAHRPEPARCAGAPATGSVQLGHPGMMATELGIPVVGDFRTADMALGGQGAPIVPYLDYMVLGASDESRLMLNLGGIANVTIVPAGASPDTVRAFDTGPANMVSDALMQRLFDQSYDPNGRYAQQGTAHPGLVADLLDAPFFQQPPPRSTGRTMFGADYAEKLWERVQDLDGSREDALATSVLLTAASIYQAYAQFVRPNTPADRVLVSGGGLRNTALMNALRRSFSPIPVASTETVGINPDMKEAICMAVLAYERTRDASTSLPAVTGARAATSLGTIYLPA